MDRLNTNELNAEFQFSAINKDYSFFRIETSEKYISGGAAFLDLEELPYLRSIVFEQGKSFYMMCSSKGITQTALIGALRAYEGGESLSLVQLFAEDLKPYLLVQLFFNALSNPVFHLKEELYAYNNLSGKLLCYKPAWLKKDAEGMLWGLDCMEVRIDRDLCLHLFAHRMNSLKLKGKMKFEKRKFSAYPQYEFSYHHHTLRRVPKDRLNNPSNLIQKPVEGERGSISFFDFSNYEAFSCTKIGLLYELLRALKAEFSKYLQLSFQTYPIEENIAYKRKELEAYKGKLSEKVLFSGIHLLDEVQSSTSASYLEDLGKEIQQFIPRARCTLGKRLSKEKLNIRYIHEKDFYHEKDFSSGLSKEIGSRSKAKHGKELDPYGTKAKGYAVQHITVENFSLKTKAAVMNIVKELCIKQDIQRGKLGMINWADFAFAADWIFGIVLEKRYFFMAIHPDGSFDIQEMQRDLFSMNEYDAYMDYFSADKEYASGDYSGVLGIIKDAKGNINLIKDTSIFSLPDFMNLGKLLENLSGSARFTGAELMALFQDILQSTEEKKVREEVEQILPGLQGDRDYTKEEILEMFRGRNTKKAIVKYIFENTGILLYAYLRGEAARKEYLSGTLDINYFTLSPSLARFCVGEIGSGMKYSIERASLVREIEAVEGSPLIFKELLPLMGVEFVRYGMLTVIPFPFKYLREYAMMEK